MTVVIGTAGHIDHGKTALLRALTGTDADRLPEEKRRGLTIDLGYVHGSPDGGPELDFVDVPGHDRLVGNMLVGVGEIDAALLVVAADDGPRAQTWEHLGLLDAMGITASVVAITKVDLVDAARVAVVASAVQDLVARTSLVASPPVPCSSTTGSGIDQLRTELAALRDHVTASASPRHHDVWLAIDRAFTIKGHGLVVTGSSRGAAIAVGDSLLVQPGAARVRVRAVQVHDTSTDVADSPGRVALNLGGAEVADLHRGQLLTAPESAGPTGPLSSDRLLVALRAPAALPGRMGDDPWPPRDGTELRVHVGTEQVGARLGRSGRVGLELRDAYAMALLRLERPVATAIGERFVLRRPPPAGLLAGGVVLDVGLPRGRARSRLDAARAQRLLDAAMADDEQGIADALLELHGARDHRLASDVSTLARASLLDAVASHHREWPGQPGLAVSAARGTVAAAINERIAADRDDPPTLADATIAAVLASGELVREGGAIRLRDHQPMRDDPEVARAAARLVAVLDVEAPPPLSAAAAEAGCPAEAVRDLERSGRIILVDDDLAWAATTFDRLRDQALMLADQGPLKPSALRDATGISRKYVMALLEDLDRRGILKRTPAGHVRGPRA